MGNTSEHIGQGMLLADLNSAIEATNPKLPLAGTCEHHAALASGVWVLLRIERERFGMRPQSTCRGAWDWVDRHPICAVVVLLVIIAAGGAGTVWGLLMP